MRNVPCNSIGAELDNWDDLRVFLAVARAGSLNGAAPSLKMDPATLSRRIHRLEKRLGATLFVKSSHGYLLTNDGKRVQDEVEVAEGPLIRAIEPGQSDPKGLSGQIKIGAPDGMANFVLPQVTQEIMAENPALEIQIVALPRIFNLSKREADIAVSVARPAAGRLSVKKFPTTNNTWQQRKVTLTEQGHFAMSLISKTID